MRKIIIFLFLITLNTAYGQRRIIDSLDKLLKTSMPDTARLKLLINLGRKTFTLNPDTTIIIGEQLYELANKDKSISDEGEALNLMANAYATVGDYAKGIQFYLKAIKNYETINDVVAIAKENNNIGSTYNEKQDYDKALPYLFGARSSLDNWAKTHRLDPFGKTLVPIILLNISESFLFTHKIDSADFYLKQTRNAADQLHYGEVNDNIDRDFGEVQAALGNKSEALRYYRQSIFEANKNDHVEDRSLTDLSIASLYHKYAQMDSAVYYAQKALKEATNGGFIQDVLNAGKLLTTLFDEDKNLPEAYKYFKITTAAKDSLFNQDKVKQLLSIDFDEKQRQQDIANAKVQYLDTVRMYLLIGGLVILLLIAFILWRTGTQRQTANKLLMQQKADLQEAMAQLQLTQKQLVQSEKMASLGELTAGIAHEIQNPLNFVNNFSEVNMELVDEMELELKNGDKDEAISIAADIKQNLEKIRHHGKRADSIVKGMLQHSRTGSTTKEITSINTLADEYLRLAYHGLRAKDKSFNAELITNFDPNLPPLAILPQEIGRVFLNLYTNAFYAVQQKHMQSGTDYKPAVEVSASAQGGNIIIKVKDNGIGMPEHVKEKIMQPFFTTKPTGQGTGLGLSMSYDIVVKGHGGTIDVNTKENEYTEFIITLPL